MTPRRRAAAALAVALALALAAAAPAAGQDVSRAELRDLAERARSDAVALAELRAVERVDGAPVDVGRALAGAEGDSLDRRLATLAEGAAPGGAAAGGGARQEAQEILSERRFRELDLPRPFRRPLQWLGDRLTTAFDRIAAVLPGGRSALWVVLGTIVVVLAALVAGRVARRRAADAVERGRASARSGAPEPGLLELEAAEAERRGDFEQALRLLFRAGLLRLDRARTIALRDSLTTGQLRRDIRSSEFDRVALVFDEVAYGGRRPGPAEVESSRSGWRRVLEEAGAR